MHDKIKLLGKAKLDTIEVLVFKALIYSYIGYEEFVSVKNVFREYNEMRAVESCGIYYINMVDISREKHERNGIKNNSR